MGRKNKSGSDPGISGSSNPDGYGEEVGQRAESTEEPRPTGANPSGGRPSDYGEIKKQHSINLTDTAWKILSEDALPKSRSEFIEGWLRSRRD